MISAGTTAVAIKVAAVGLEPERHLGATLAALYPLLLKLEKRFEVHVCGEGGEYESFVTDSCLYVLPPKRKRPY
jgi:diphthine-ammonia ligase